MTGRELYDEKLDEKNRAYLIGKPELLTKYYYYCKRSRSKTGTSTRNSLTYAWEFMRFLQNHGMNPNDINVYSSVLPMDMDAYQEEFGYCCKDGVKRKLESGTMAVKFNAVKDFFCFLKQNGIIEKNPFIDMQAPKNKKQYENHYLTQEEVNNVINVILTASGMKEGREKTLAIKYRYRNLSLFLLAIVTGVRVSTLHNLNVEDLDFKNKCFTSIDKGNKTCVHYFDDKTAESLQNWLEDRSVMMKGRNENALFVSNNYYSRMTTTALYNLVEKYTGASPHKLRHTCAMLIYTNTSDLELASKVLNHSNITTTQRYASATDEMKKNAANLVGSLF